MKRRLKQLTVVATLCIAILMQNALGIHAYAASNMMDNVNSDIDKYIQEKVDDSSQLNVRSSAEIISDSYFIGDIFVCTEIYPTGEIVYAYNDNDMIYFRKYDNGVVTESKMYSNTATTLSATEFQVAALEDLIETENDGVILENKEDILSSIGYEEVTENGCTYYYLIDSEDSVPNSLSYTIKAVEETPVIHNGMNLLTDKFPPLSRAHSSTTSFYCNYLGVNKNVIIYDTRTNYVETGNKHRLCEAGTSVAEAAVALMLNVTDLRNWLGLASSVMEFPTDAYVYNSTEAKAYHYRWAEIYDSTSLNGYIDFCYHYGYDYFSVTAQNDSGPFSWSLNLSPTPVVYTYTDSYIADEAARGYNNALDMYGYWPN